MPAWHAPLFRLIKGRFWGFHSYTSDENTFWRWKNGTDLFCRQAVISGTGTSRVVRRRGGGRRSSTCFWFAFCQWRIWTVDFTATTSLSGRCNIKAILLLVFLLHRKVCSCAYTLSLCRQVAPPQNAKVENTIKFGSFRPSMAIK